MHKQLLFELKEPEGYFIKNDTKENLGKELKLYCYKSDENNIYLDKPVIDYPDYYSIVKPNGDIIPLRKQFEDRGFYKNFFVIISRHKNLTSIENFFIEECNSFYSIKISKEVKGILEAIGLENLTVDKKLFDYNLINIKNNANGYEILFFVKSDKNYINGILNEYRLKIIKQKIDLCADEYCEKGVSLISKDGKSLHPLKYNIANRIKIFEENNVNSLNLLENNCKFIRKYADVLYQRIKMLINTKDINYLYFGYTDDWIVEELAR